MGLINSPFSFTGKRAIWIYWAVTGCMVLGMMCLIFHFSAANDVSSSHLSHSFSERIILFLEDIFSLNLSNHYILDLVEIIDYPIRKMAHFSEYAILGWLVHMHFYGSRQLDILPQKGSFFKGRSHVLALLVCFLYSVSDEIHQYFVPGRACRIFDVFVDSSGALFGALVFSVIFYPLLDAVCRKVYNEKK